MKTLLNLGISGASLWIITEFMEIFQGQDTFVSVLISIFWHPLMACGIWGLHRAQTGAGKNILSSTSAAIIASIFLIFIFIDLFILQMATPNFSLYVSTRPWVQILLLGNILGFVLFAISIISIKALPVWTGYALLLLTPAGAAMIVLEVPIILTHIVSICLCLIMAYQSFFALGELKASQLQNRPA